MKRILLISILAACVISLSALISYAEEPAQPDELAGITHANSPAAALKITEEAVSKCAATEDFEKLASNLKRIVSEKSNFKYIDALYYAIAKVRTDELAFLSKKNDIDSGRLYMSLNESYRKEASEYVDMALKNTKSKDLMLDLYFLKFMALKEELQPQKTDSFLDEMALRISKYSDDGSVNARQLDRIAAKFTDNGLADYALKLKIAYARDVDPKAAQEIFENIKKEGDKNFAQGNMKSAAATYNTYVAAARSYFSKEIMAAKIMEIAEKYFGANRYREAGKYYESYAEDYPDSRVIDYCKYRRALCYYYEKDYTNAVTAFENFLSSYQNSVWFDRAFETLCRLYFSDFPKDTAVAGLKKAVTDYYRKNIGDLAYVLTALLHYSDKEYPEALEDLKKVDMNSAYSYMADSISADIKDIKNGSNPSYSFGSKDKYRMWEPGKPVTVDLVPMEAGDPSAWLKGSASGGDKKLEVTYTPSGAAQVTVKPGAKVKFTLGTLADEDNFAEYLQDKEDLSRLPKKVKDESEKDLLSLQWACEGGKFADERQARDKTWIAPPEPGAYKISLSVDDLGIVRVPDKGIRKDATKEITIIVNVA